MTRLRRKKDCSK